MARGNQPDNLPAGEVIDRERRALDGRGKLTSWEAIGNRYGVSRQAAHKKWTQWRNKQAKAGVIIDNPRPPKKDDVTSQSSPVTTDVDESSSDESTNASLVTSP